MKKQENKTSITLTKLCSVSVPIIALYCQYSVGKISLGLIIASLISVVCLIKKNSLKIYIPFVYFSGFYIIRRMMNFWGPYGKFTAKTIYDIGIIILVAVSIIIISSFINEDILYKTWFIAGIFVSLLVIIQAIKCNIMKQLISPVLIGPVDFSVDNWKLLTNRPMACFSEPTMVSIFLSPILFMSLKRNKITSAAFFSIVILLTTSTIGIVDVLIIWGLFYILKREISMGKKIILGIILVIIALIVISLPLFTNTFSKLMTELDGTANSYVRLQFGYQTFNELGFWNKLIGIWEQSVEELRLSGRIYVQVINKGIYNYVNSIQSILIYTGILGIFLWIGLLIKMIRDIQKEYLPYLILQIILMFCSSVFYNPISLIPYIFMLSLMEKNYIIIKYRK